jgi:orotate phosphoribosyltransferase
LLDLLKRRSFRRAAPGELFTLASGAKSEYFIDGKMTAVSSEGAEPIADRVSAPRLNEETGIDAIGGLQVGAVPLVTAAVIGYQRHGRPVEGFWVREDLKDQGTRKQIEGGVKRGTRLVIVDHAFTRGGPRPRPGRSTPGRSCPVPAQRHRELPARLHHPAIRHRRTRRHRSRYSLIRCSCRDT